MVSKIFKQSNRCIIIGNNNIPTTCPVNTVLQNGVCVPILGTCPIGYTLQNGVCVPTNPTQSAPVAVPMASPSSTTGGNFVQLNGLSSYATTSGATIVSYSWFRRLDLLSFMASKDPLRRKSNGVYHRDIDYKLRIDETDEQVIKLLLKDVRRIVA